MENPIFLSLSLVFKPRNSLKRNTVLMDGPLHDRSDERDDSLGFTTLPPFTRQEGDQDRSLELAGSDFLLGC